MASLDFSGRCDETRSDELGCLAHNLNCLSDSLSHSMLELQEANAQLKTDIEKERELERQRMDFFGAASHELKTPLTVLKGHLSGMLNGVVGYENHSKYLQRSLAVTEKMEVLIREGGYTTDREIIKFLVCCFDRPAFRDPICQEGRMEDFDKAIEDTIIALNTGILRTRDGNILRKSEGKSAISNDEWREKLNVIGDMLSALRRRLKIAKAAGAYSTYGEGEVMYCFSDRQLGEWFDSTREEILKILSSICEDMGMSGLRFPRNKYRW